MGIRPGTWYLIIVVVASILLIGVLAAAGQVVKTQREAIANYPSSGVSNVIIPIRSEAEVNEIAHNTLSRLRFEGVVRNTEYNFANGKWTVHYEATTAEGKKDIEVQVDDRTLRIEKIYFLLIIPELRPLDLSLEGQPIQGNKSAPLVMIELGDFDCASCKDYHDHAYQQIKEQYIDTGKLRYVFVNYPLSSVHSRAEKAAEAVECAHQQGKFWEYREMLYDNWDPDAPKNALSEEDLKNYAGKLGLDQEQFDTCLDTGQVVVEVQDDYDNAIKIGATVAPSFYIDGNLIGGAQSFEVFRQVIDYKLKES